MPISIAENAALALHIVAFEARVPFSEIEALGRIHAENLAWAAADTVHIIGEDTDLSEISDQQLDAMRAHYRAVHGGIDFFLLRRSGWVCRSPGAWRAVEYWLRERHSRDGQGTEVFLATTLQELDDLFSADEIEAVASRAGFVELWRTDHGTAPDPHSAR